MNKTKIKVISAIQHEADIAIGTEGYIDGYVRGGNDAPYVACIFGKRIVLARPYDLEVITNTKVL